MKKAFISWSNVDPRIGPLAVFFKNWMIDVFGGKISFFFSKEIRVGSDWREEIEVALRTSEFALFFLSQRTARSPWVMFEFGSMEGNAKKGNLFPILFDMQPSELAKVCPPIAHLQAISLQDEDEFFDLIALISDRVSESPEQGLQIRSTAKREYASLRAYLDGISLKTPALPDKFSGLVPFNYNIQQSSNYQMPEIFRVFKQNLFLVGINLGFLLNLPDNASRFEALMDELIKDKQKTVDLLISNLEDPHIRYTFEKIELGRVSKELAGFDRVFTNKNDGFYIDNYIRKCCADLGGSYDDIRRRLRIKKIDMLMDTFWFADASTASGSMMMIFMTGSEGSSRPVYYVNFKENVQLYDYYHKLCRGGFDTMGQNVWPHESIA